MTLSGQPVIAGPNLSKGDTLSSDYLQALEHKDWFKLRMADDSLNELLEKAEAQLIERRKSLEERYEDKKRKLQTGDDLRPACPRLSRAKWVGNVGYRRVTRWAAGKGTRVVTRS